MKGFQAYLVFCKPVTKWLAKNEREGLTRLLRELEGFASLIGRILYGSGLWLGEEVSLRVRDIEFDRGCLMVRAARGDEDRMTILPESAKGALMGLPDVARKRYDGDRERGRHGVELPYTIAKKYPSVGKEWGWEGWHDIRTIQKLLSHRSIKTTTIYPQVAEKNRLGGKNPPGVL